MSFSDFSSSEEARTGREPRWRGESGPSGEPGEHFLAEFSAHLDRGELREALGVLNARTRFRYTGAYRFAPPLLHSVAVFDREHPRLAVRAELPIVESYCSIVAASEREVCIDDAAADVRATNHPARARYSAYCGVPLQRGDGTVFGTLCHFDPRPRIGSEAELAMLTRVAPLVARQILAG
jgi:GAF domain-containing protein